MMDMLSSRTTAAALAAALIAAPAQGQTRPDTVITLAEAQAVAARAQRAAAEKKIDVAMVVVNREGRVILAQRMDRSSYIHLELAERKAATAAATGAPTSLLEKVVDAGKTSLLSVPEIALIGGAVPLRRGDEVIGGVGVSGGSPEDDENISLAAAGI
ncbi:heme-binding protein [Sphingopyxis sp.]|uniref:heme-binding protein n=1 Tax=Sphingopyxis sp. TaxID=1908224 RepID=UPI001D3BFA0B|nr:heme-binding protein [Sphingopyxis sp.]MBW8296334.1 heme-binding protein [Sphingopyxis sp.]